MCENHPEELAQLLPYVDILFGFVEEYKTLESRVDLPKLAETHTQHPDPSLLINLPRILDEVHLPNKKSSPKKSTSSGEKSGLSNGSNGSPMEEDSGIHEGNDSSLSDRSSRLTELSPNHSNDPTESNNSSEEIRLHHSKEIFENNETLVDEQANCTLQANFGKVIILTQGPYPLLYVSSDGVVKRRTIEPLKSSEIVDTTGAGDSFVGGFLAALCMEKDLESCVEGGVTAARHILQQKGCTLPSYPANFF